MRSRSPPQIISELRRLNAEFRAEGPFAPGFEPPHCTVSTGVIAGGSALNIVPEQCRFEFEFRPLPGQHPDALFAGIRGWAERTLLPAMRAVFPGADIAWQELMSYPALGVATGATIEEVCCRLTGTERPIKLAFGTEAGHFATRGIPTVVCGPGEIRVAHRPDEYVELSQLEVRAVPASAGAGDGGGLSDVGEGGRNRGAGSRRTATATPAFLA